MLRYLSANSRMPSQTTIQNLYIPSDLDREFPLAPHYVQTFGSYPNYLHFNDDFKPSAQQLLDSRGFTLVNSSTRVNDEGWHVIDRIYQHEDGMILKAEYVGDRFFRLYGYYRDETLAKGLMDGLQEHKYVHEDNQTHIYLIQSGRKTNSIYGNRQSTHRYSSGPDRRAPHWAYRAFADSCSLV